MFMSKKRSWWVKKEVLSFPVLSHDSFLSKKENNKKYKI